MPAKKESPGAPPPPPIGVLVDTLYYQVNRSVADRLQAAGFSELRAAHGKVFENLGGGCRVSELAERAQVTKQSMAELVAYLEEHNYLVRSPDSSDRRAKIVRLTPRGEQAVREAELILEAIYAEWLARLGRRRLDEFQHTLSRLIQITSAL